MAEIEPVGDHFVVVEGCSALLFGALVEPIADCEYTNYDNKESKERGNEVKRGWIQRFIGIIQNSGDDAAEKGLIQDEHDINVEDFVPVEFVEWGKCATVLFCGGLEQFGLLLLFVHVLLAFTDEFDDDEDEDDDSQAEEHDVHVHDELLFVVDVV